MRKEALNLTDEIKKEIKSRLLKKDINKEEVYRQCYRETVEFIMNEFKLTTEEACQYINVNPYYSLGIRIKASKLLIETNLSRNG